MAGEVVPFGKYRGKPVEALAQDRQYVDWLTAQPGFKGKFGNFYTLIVNNFQEPSETPEHNALQIKFLDENFQLAFLKFLDSRCPSNVKKSVRFEEHGFDVHVSAYLEGPIPEGRIAGPILYDAGYSIEIKPTIGDDYPAILRKMKLAENQHYTNRKPVLLVGEYVGVGATKEQFVAFFKAASIGVVFLA